MLREISALAAVAALSASTAYAQPPSGTPSPRERLGMFIGDTTANGSATIVTDRTGAHPDGFTGMAIVNPISAANDPDPAPSRHHRHARQDSNGGH